MSRRAAGLRHAAQLARRAAVVGDVLEHVGRRHEVERAVLERQLLDPRLRHLPEPARVAERDRVGRRIDPRGLPQPRVLADVAARPAAGVEDARRARGSGVRSSSAWMTARRPRNHQWRVLELVELAVDVLLHGALIVCSAPDDRAPSHVRGGGALRGARDPARRPGPAARPDAVAVGLPVDANAVERLTPHGVRLFGANGELADAVAAFQPFTQHARSVLPSWPLWNPSISAGRPFLADMQSGVLSPFSLPSYMLPFWFSLAVVAALKLWVAAFGTFLLGRALGMRFAAALLGGLAFGFSLLHGHVARLAAVERLGADAVAAARGRPRDPRRPDAAGVALLALVTGLQFLCGHPESSFHVVRRGGAVRRAAAARARPTRGAARRARGARPGRGRRRWRRSC